MWKMFWATFRTCQSSENSHRRETILMLRMGKMFWATFRSCLSSENSHRRETILMF
ncbi:Hypothetical predicted protein [Pelobates cultripes]|uniref:Uncharacterized protein n=1 Tax=Pelobates cultripes TaxID=61616 RepID=A0AAD1TS99_PELCU|nr:Hypothetical predicted protein [Pelobates cultripes]CAH2329483.1 Hypothetical predicted protein [Pelobates cultripes]